MLETIDQTVRTDDGIALHLEIDGPADADLAVVFVHGFTLNLNNWALQRSHLAQASFRRVFFDQRGFGRSERGVGVASIRQLASDLKAVLDSLPGSVILVGHSMGGMTIQALAGIHPELFGTKVLGTVLVATAARGRDLDVFGLARIAGPVGVPALRQLFRVSPLVARSGRVPYHLTAWLFHDLRSSRAHRRAFVEMVEKTPFDVMADYLQAMLDYDERESLSAIGSAPTIVVAGDTDRITPVSANLEVAQAISGSKLVVAAVAGHMVPFERADVVNAAIDAVVARARPE